MRLYQNGRRLLLPIRALRQTEELRLRVGDLRDCLVRIRALDLV